MPHPVTTDPLAADAHAKSPWQAFARRVLFDYPPAARAAWLAITLPGAKVTGGSAMFGGLDLLKAD